jgi:hypothetical protein
LYRTLVAVAHKHARILWAILAKDESFNPSYVPNSHAVIDHCTTTA